MADPTPKAPTPNERLDRLAAHIAGAMVARNGATFASAASVAKTASKLSKELLRELDAQ